MSEQTIIILNTSLLGKRNLAKLKTEDYRALQEGIALCGKLFPILLVNLWPDEEVLSCHWYGSLHRLHAKVEQPQFRSIPNWRHYEAVSNHRLSGLPGQLQPKVKIARL